jgi:hypothetical protein
VVAQPETAASDSLHQPLVLPPSISTHRQGLAVASLVLGILSVMCFGLLAGIPAIILGHIAYARARRAPHQYTGGGLATAGFVMGYLSILTTLLLVGVLAGLGLPALAKAKEKAQSISCVNNLKQIGVAFSIWANEHDDQFPFETAPAQGGVGGEDPVLIFKALRPNLVDPKILVCPGDSAKKPALTFQELESSNISYELETGPKVRINHPEEILMLCPIHGHVLHCDGTVQ